MWWPDESDRFHNRLFRSGQDHHPSQAHFSCRMPSPPPRVLQQELLLAAGEGRLFLRASMAASSRFQRLGLSYKGAFCCLCSLGSICWQLTLQFLVLYCYPRMSAGRN